MAAIKELAVTMGDPVANSGRLRRRAGPVYFSGLLGEELDPGRRLIHLGSHQDRWPPWRPGSLKEAVTSSRLADPSWTSRRGGFDHLPLKVFGDCRTGLPRHRATSDASFEPLPPRTAPQGACATDLRVELKTLDRVGLAQPVGPGTHGA